MKRIVNFFRRIIRKYIPRYKVSVTLDEANGFICNGLESNKPFLCARLGCTELQTIIFVRLSQKLGCIMKPFWNHVLQGIWNSSGVFNPSPSLLYKFANLYESLFPEIDLLVSWHQSERYFDKFLGSKKKIGLLQLGPDIVNESWTASLEGKRVLVVHPFADTILSQYAKREELHGSKNILPQFKSLEVIKAVQSIAGNVPDGYDNWFDALNDMRSKMERIDYDVALIGCGAYGFPLAAWAKQAGKKVILMGGSLQLLFGIKGNRWLVYGTPDMKHAMNNPAWVFPSALETPKNSKAVPEHAYW